LAEANHFLRSQKPFLELRAIPNKDNAMNGRLLSKNVGRLLLQAPRLKARAKI